MMMNGITREEEMTMQAIQSMNRSVKKIEEKTPTLRDQFAMQYLNGYCSNLGTTPSVDVMEEIVSTAYHVADIMIKARGEEK